VGVCKVKEGWLNGLRQKCLRGFKKDMCDPVLIAAILEELGYFDEKKEKDKKGEVRDEESSKGSSENRGEADQK
jgi:hypothetical protein